MKQITAFVHPHRAADLLHALEAAGFARLSLTGVKGSLKAASARQRDFSVELGDELSREVEIKVFCEDEQVQRAIEILRQLGRTGQTEAGWVFVSPVEQAFTIDGTRG